jgi:large subunit ribosomal protein L22
LEQQDQVKQYQQDKEKMVKKQNNVKEEHIAKASSLNLAISTKHSVEISNFLRYKPLSFAKAYLEDVIEMKKAIPLKRFNTDVGHKVGMAAGRYPVKAAKMFLVLLNSVEANAQFKGLNTSGLKITKILSNKASIPSTGGRSRTGTKRTHLEIEVKEMRAKKEDKKVKTEAKTEALKTEVKTEEKKEEPVAEVKEEAKTEKVPKEEVKEEPKVEVKTEEKKEEPVAEVKEEAKEEVKEDTKKEITDDKESKELKESVEEKKE